MDEYTADSFVNRDEPIPIITFDQHDYVSGDDDSNGEEGRRNRIKSTSRKLKEMVQQSKGKASEGRRSMQDRLMEKLMQQLIPIEDQNASKDQIYVEQTFIERPSFNITTMSNNFRRFNSRIGVVFVFQSRMIKLMSWKTWSHTLSFLAVYTFVCLDPYLLSVLPLIILLLAVLIPSFITRHPAPPTNLTSNSFEYSPYGPPIAPAATVKPVKELSKDFFRNMRDLQNCMEDFSQVHDQIIAFLGPRTNFSDEPLSSTLFLFLCISAAFMFIASHLMPWRFIFLSIGWFATCSGHPKVQNMMMASHKDFVVPHEEQAKSWLDTWIARDIILDSEPETREVEIFELQKLTNAGEWESWLFSSTPYDPLSPARISDERPKGSHFFEDVQAPRGWEWSEKKWALDLWSREWVEERIITSVEVETEGERWVYDINYEDRYDEGIAESSSPKKGKMPLPSWEDGAGSGVGRRGEWRRRRWVRMVKRKDLSKDVEGR